MYRQTSEMMLHGGILKYSDILQEAAQGCTLSLASFKVFIIDLTGEVEAAKQGVKVGGYMALRLMFANDFVGIPET